MAVNNPMNGRGFRMIWALITVLILAQCGNSDDPKDTKKDNPKDKDTETDTEGDGTDTDGNDSDIEYALALLVDDFEDGDHEPIVGNGWFSYDDSSNSGASTVTITEEDGNVTATGEGYESEHSLSVSYALDKGESEYEPYIGWGVNLGADEDTPYDASGFGGITYMYKGNAHIMMVQIFDVTDYDDYHVDVPAADEWTRATLPFTEFAQWGWGRPVAFNRENVQNLGWQVKGATGDEGDILIDDVGFLEAIDADTDTDPDLVLHDPDPPEEETLDTLEIDNPMQTLAMEALNKGYNITNWLEQDKFESYQYDEDYINALADNGFKALRLPIDLDLYIADRDAYFEGDADFAIEDVLFEILDNFGAWTEAAGMSLTIDYHQYDGSFDMGNELYTDAVVALWTAVADHFADTPREDLFYELMNEPELAGDVGSVKQSDWTDFATEIIGGIRSKDDTHGILFGDVEWNGITPLTKRTPFEDDKVIYVIHFYEPFVFTHQGASWSGMGTVRDIPYPYSKDRWSEYSADFGFSPTTDSWIFSALNQYYRNGFKSWMKNELIDAKRWAVENNVPVICNEFGAYDRASTLDDRVRYYTDLIDIFEELEIPWQHWFMTVDDDGEMDPDLVEAFGL
jgi:endoglucanase